MTHSTLKGLCLSALAAAAALTTWSIAASSEWNNYQSDYIRIEDTDKSDAPALNKVSFIGKWTSEALAEYSAGNAHYTNKNVWGANAGEVGYEIVFNGTAISLYGNKAPAIGDAIVYLDGEEAGSFNATHSPRTVQSFMYSLDGLSAGEHTLKVVAAKSGGSLNGLALDYALVKTSADTDSTFSLSPASATLAPGETLDLETVNGTDGFVLWRSLNPEVAEIRDGKVTAVSEGTARITAEDENGVTAETVITVSAQEGAGE